MNFVRAKKILRDGGRITRPNWEEGHYWELSKDGFERIICHDGTSASVHLKQIEAEDWEIFEEEKISLKKIQKAMSSFLLEICVYPNAINIGGIPENSILTNTELFGMRIRSDEFLEDGDFYLSYEYQKKSTGEKPCLK